MKEKRVINIGQVFTTWKVLSIGKDYKCECECIKCGQKKVISKYMLLNNTYGLCKQCGLESVLEANIDVILQYWNNDLNEVYDVKEIIKNPTKTYWFTCANGHNFKKSLRDFTPESCPKCKRTFDMKPIPKLQGDTFSNCFPQLVPYWNYRKNKYTPSNVTSKDFSKKFWFMCAKGHEFSRTIKQIQKGSWCPFCNNTFNIRKLEILTLEHLKTLGHEAYYDNDEGIIRIPKTNTIIMIKPEKDFDLDYDTLLRMKKIRTKYKLPPYNFHIITSTNNLENDVDKMKFIVLEY